MVHYSDRQDSGKKGKLTEIKGISILPSAPVSTVGNKQESTTSDFPSPTTVPLNTIPKLIEDAKQVEHVLQQRKQRQDEILDQL